MSTDVMEALASRGVATVLFIKTSSLGDVIHHMPAVTEARRKRPDARISWVVEQAFAPLVRLHGSVDALLVPDVHHAGLCSPKHFIGCESPASLL